MTGSKEQKNQKTLNNLANQLTNKEEIMALTLVIFACFKIKFG